MNGRTKRTGREQGREINMENRAKVNRTHHHHFHTYIAPPRCPRGLYLHHKCVLALVPTPSLPPAPTDRLDPYKTANKKTCGERCVRLRPQGIKRNNNQQRNRQCKVRNHLPPPSTSRIPPLNMPTFCQTLYCCCGGSGGGGSILLLLQAITHDDYSKAYRCCRRILNSDTMEDKGMTDIPSSPAHPSSPPSATLLPSFRVGHTAS